MFLFYLVGGLIIQIRFCLEVLFKGEVGGIPVVFYHRVIKGFSYKLNDIYKYFYNASSLTETLSTD